MQTRKVSRRAALRQAGWLTGATLAGAGLSAAPATPTTTTGAETTPFLFCLNTATIRGQKVGLAKEIEIAAQAGYQGLEPWLDTIEQYQAGGGSLAEARRRLADAGLTVEGAIAFPQWLVEDDARRAQALEQLKRQMDRVVQLGGKRIATPPAGATDVPLERGKVVERYRAVLELGDQMGIVPELELWGFSKNLHLVGECAGVAIDTGHPKACVLIDVFHLYKGGSDWQGLHLLSGPAIQELHMNDYPADPPRDRINDGFRVFPGDGVAPLAELLRALRALGGRKVLSLELFSQKYWKQDPLEVARAGLAKMQAVASAALASA